MKVRQILGERIDDNFELALELVKIEKALASLNRVMYLAKQGKLDGRN